MDRRPHLSQKTKSLFLKAKYNLADLLSWTYHANRTMFDVLVERTPSELLKHELLSNYYHEGYRNVMLQAAGQPADRVGDQAEINTVFADMAKYCHSLLDQPSRDWLHGRGVTDEQIDRHQIGCTRGYNPFIVLLEKLASGVRRNCCFYPPLVAMDAVKTHFSKEEMVLITVPFVERPGSVSNLCCRVTDDDYTEVFKFFFSHGPTALFNLDKIDASKPFFVFEGVFDVLAAERHGIPSVGLGCSTLSQEQLALLAPHYGKAVLCLDGDVAGRKGMDGINMPKHVLPPGDPDDILTATPSYAATLRDCLLSHR